jgi:transposase
METNKMFTQLLHLPKEWEVYEVIYHEETKSVHVQIRYLSSEGVCRETGEVCSVVDYRKERSWRHLDMLGYKTYLYCRVPRVKNSLGKISSIAVPWADDDERHTRDFENYATRVLQATKNQTQAGELLDVSYEKVNRVMRNSVERGLSRRDLSSETIVSLSIDEKSYKKGHCYATIISEQTRKRVIDVGKERTQESAELLMGKAFTEEQLSSIKAVCVDMWDPFISAIKKSVRTLRSFMISFTLLPISIKA